MKDLKVSCLQLRAHDIEDAEKALAQALAAVDAEARHEPDLMVLPECIYPAYYLAPWLGREDLGQRLKCALDRFAKKAVEWGIWLCVGLVEAAGGVLYNSAYLIDRQGVVRGTARKHLLWHFDRLWFETGADFSVVDVDNAQGETCKVGMIICADGRVMEVSRCLTLQGAALILNVTNWVTHGRQKDDLSNIQAKYMMSCRAKENQVYIACANKVGMEKRSILYCGRSQVVGPDGNVMVMASSDREETIRSVVDFSPSKTPTPPRLHPVEARRPYLYRALVDDPPPCSRTRPDGSLGIGLIQSALDDSDSLERAGDYVKLLEEQGAQLVLLGEPHHRLWESDQALSGLGRAMQNKETLVAFVARETDGTSHYKTLFLMNGHGVQGKYRKTHLEAHEQEQFQAGDSIVTWSLGHLTLGGMLGYEGMIPEIARLHMIKGAHIVLWPRACEERLLSVAVTRAAENRLFVAMADNLSAGTGSSAVIDPAGQFNAPLLNDHEQAGVVVTLPAMAEHKLVAPATDVMAGRQPKRYHHLLMDTDQSAN